MQLVDIISAHITEAMKLRDKERLATLRLLKSALKNEEIELMRPLSEEEANAVLHSQIKSRKQAIELYERGNRPELAAIEKNEIVIIESFLPKSLTEYELMTEVRLAIAELGAVTKQDLGKVMKYLKEKLGNLADGKILSNLVRNALEQ
jgi:hypothetical protein